MNMPSHTAVAREPRVPGRWDEMGAGERAAAAVLGWDTQVRDTLKSRARGPGVAAAEYQ